MADPKIPASALRAFVSRALVRSGVPAEDANTVAELMVEADLLGHDTHGVFRLRQYLARLRDGGFNPVPQPKVANETPAIAVLDGDNGWAT